ncbi:hypothetical protein JD79_00030 [Geodermatophilus normandii]|uniref:DUF5313 domain-containing protein n=1 Tax=Geodermatophilus normandii TaxID=1137989 RepID=A0A317QEY1_9ACTN|nr:DUF5313 family protein [Geodermatophilus normandii]PWW20905.1 hypothetical protein JD79_00030 [Geodermatophilus normandii]
MAVIEQEHANDMSNPTAGAASDEPIVRPAVHRWLWYALGGGLPRRNRGWVLFDTTTGTWWARHVVRSLVQMAVPILAVMLVLPAGWGLRIAVAGGGVALGLVYSLAYMVEATENRVVKAGYPVGIAGAIREERWEAREEKDRARRRAAAAKRAARYRDRTGH